jgi:hypothetical protein
MEAVSLANSLTTGVSMTTYVSHALLVMCLILIKKRALRHQENRSRFYNAILNRYITVQLFNVKLGRYFIFLPISIIY